MAQDKPPNRDCAPGPPRPWETVKGVPRQSGYAVTVTKPACALACLVVLVLHLPSSVQVVVMDGTQGWGELPEARRRSTSRWVCFSRERTGGTTALYSDIPVLGPWDEAKRLAIKNHRTKCPVSRFGSGGSLR